jgi:signal transduction histidine kinase
VAHRDPARAPLVAELAARYPPRLVPGTPLWRTLHEGRPHLAASVADDVIARISHDARHAELLEALGLGTMLFVPLAARGRVRGALGLFGSRAGRALAPADLAVAQEIARRAALTLDNARLYGEAQAAVRARDEFLSIASHELRTPVAAIKGVAQLLARRRRRGTLEPEDLDRWLRQIADNSDRLATLIEDLLDVGRLRSGRYELRPEEVDLVALGRQQLDELAERGDGRHALVFRGEGTYVVRADRTRIEQVLANLLQNAIKYAPRGGTVEVTVHGDADGATVAVRDEGIGLPAGALESVFTPFGRAPNAAAHQIPGMGLGLYVCREIVERHGGHIWAESAGDGHGATFSFRLPCGATEAPADRPLPASGTSPQHA